MLLSQERTNHGSRLHEDYPISGSFPRFGDVAHVSHLELLTPGRTTAWPSLPRSWACTRPRGPAIRHLRAWGDYERHTLKLTAHTTSGLGHLGLRVRDDATLQRLVATSPDTTLSAGGPRTRRTVRRTGLRRRMATPSNCMGDAAVHSDAGDSTAFKNQPQRSAAGHCAASPRSHQSPGTGVGATRHFFQNLLGLRLTEQIILDNGSETGAWLSAPTSPTT